MLNDIFPEQKEERIKTRDSRKIFEEVFDTRTIESIKKLASKHAFDKIEKIISTGKEGNVFQAHKGNTNCAIKIYRIETSSFDTMIKYIQGDPRFNKIKRNKQNLVYEWTKKEFKNLTAANKSGVNVPYPVDYNKNVLVMEFIGKDDAQPTLKDDKNIEKNITEIYKQTIKNLNKLVYGAKIVHADLSEYNMIFFNKKLYFIDLGQAVSIEHPYAKEFYNRDIQNMVKFFNKYDINVNEDELKQKIKNYK